MRLYSVRNFLFYSYQGPKCPNNNETHQPHLGPLPTQLPLVQRLHLSAMLLYFLACNCYSHACTCPWPLLILGPYLRADLMA